MVIGKQLLLDMAEVIDAWRVFPRTFLLIYIWFLWDVHNAYTHQAVPQWYAAYASLVWGGLVAITKWYQESGRKW